jgi:hypothetical protein
MCQLFSALPGPGGVGQQDNVVMRSMARALQAHAAWTEKERIKKQQRDAPKH